LQNFIKNNLYKVSRRRARDRVRNPSRPKLRRDFRDRDSQKRVSRRVSKPRPYLKTPSLLLWLEQVPTWNKNSLWP